MKTKTIQLFIASAAFAMAAFSTGPARAEVTSAMDYNSDYRGSSGGGSYSQPSNPASYSNNSGRFGEGWNDHLIGSTDSPVYPASTYERVSGRGSARQGETTSTTYLVNDLTATVTYINGWPVYITFRNRSTDTTYWVSNVGGENQYNMATRTWGREIKPEQSLTLSLGYYYMYIQGNSPAVTFDYQYYQKKAGTGSLGMSGPNNTSLTNFSSTPSTGNGTRFSSVTQPGGTSRSTFTIRHRGAGTMILRGTPTVKLAGSDASQFRVAVQPSSRINAGGSTSYVVEYVPTASGTHTATVCFYTNDPSARTVSYTISCTASLPAAQISYFEWKNGTSLRVWQRSGTVWTERTPTGSVETFDTIGSGTIGSATAIWVRSRLDSRKELMIPNLPHAATAGLWCRNNNGAWTLISATLSNYR